MNYVRISYSVKMLDPVSVFRGMDKAPAQDLKNSAAGAVGELETMAEIVRKMVKSAEGDSVEVQQLISDLEERIRGFYAVVNQLPETAKGDAAFWGNLLQRVDRIWQATYQMGKAAEARRNAAAMSEFGAMVSQACQKNNRMATIVNRAKKDLVSSSTEMRSLLGDINDLYKTCVVISNRLNAFKRDCSDESKPMIQEMLQIVCGIRGNCVHMSRDLKAAKGGMGNQERYSPRSVSKELASCRSKAELLAKLKELQALLEG